MYRGALSAHSASEGYLVSERDRLRAVSTS
jgi:hypothetical protein